MNRIRTTWDNRKYKIITIRVQGCGFKGSRDKPFEEKLRGVG